MDYVDFIYQMAKLSKVVPPQRAVGGLPCPVVRVDRSADNFRADFVLALPDGKETSVSLSWVESVLFRDQLPTRRGCSVIPIGDMWEVCFSFIATDGGNYVFRYAIVETNEMAIAVADSWQQFGRIVGILKCIHCTDGYLDCSACRGRGWLITDSPSFGVDRDGSKLRFYLADVLIAEQDAATLDDALTLEWYWHGNGRLARFTGEVDPNGERLLAPQLPPYPMSSPVPMVTAITFDEVEHGFSPPPSLVASIRREMRRQGINPDEIYELEFVFTRKVNNND